MTEHAGNPPTTLGRLARPAPVVLVVALLAGLLAGCGGSSPPEKVTDPFAYDRSAPLDTSVESLGPQGAVDVDKLTYTSFDGQRVPALLATPHGQPSSGCLIYQGGVGQPKETAKAIWPGAAALGLSTFTIDLRATGERGSTDEIKAILGDAGQIKRTLHGDVIDLRRALDLLARRKECHGRIGYLGTSNGGTLGALLAGDDRRVKALAITSLGATWKAALVSSDVILPGVGSDPARLARAVRTLSPYDPARWVRKVAPRPVMIVNGSADPYVAPVDARNLAAAAQRPKQIVTFPGGHNPFAGTEGPAVARKIGQFFVRELVELPLLLMRVVIPVIGTHGDVQPFAVLGSALARAGHEVRVATHERFRPLIEDRELDFQALGGDPDRMWEDRRWQELRVSAWNPRPHVRTIREVFGELVADSHPEELGATWTDADAIVFSATTAFAAHVAGELRIPSIMGAATPMVATREFGHPVVAPRLRAGRAANVATWLAAERLQGQAVREPARPAQRRRHRLPPFPLAGSRGHSATWPPFPVLHAFSPAVVPRPADWPAHVHETGWWLPEPGDEPLGDAVEAFLVRRTAAAVRRLREHGDRRPRRPGSHTRGSAGSRGRPGDRQRSRGRVPARPTRPGPRGGPAAHGRLFGRVAAVVHHGGSGTVGTGLRAGRPTLVVPFVFDQFFWGRRVAAIGAGPEPLPFAELAPEPLARAMATLREPAVQAAAARAAQGIAADEGPAAAVAVVEQALA